MSKVETRLKAKGYVKASTPAIQHVHPSCKCGGRNAECPQVYVWFKPKTNETLPKGGV